MPIDCVILSVTCTKSNVKKMLIEHFIVTFLLYFPILYPFFNITSGDLKIPFVFC